MITIAVDAMGGDHAPRPEVEGSVLVHGNSVCGFCSSASRKSSARSWQGRPRPSADRDCGRQRRDHHAGSSGSGFSPEEGQLGPRGRASGARSQGRRHGKRGKHRRGHDRRRSFARNAGIGGSRRAGSSFSQTPRAASPCSWTWARMWIEPEHLVQFAVMGEVYYARRLAASVRAWACSLSVKKRSRAMN